MGLGGRIRIDEYESEGEIVLRVVGNRLRDLLRRDTRVQSALAHLVARAAERTREDAVVRLEMEGEDSSEAKLEELAQTKARDALSQRKEVVLPPMTSRERWIVHNALRTIAGVRTESVGEGRLKRVKIVPS
jgi:spoIIIJ-associated protein